MSAPIPRDALSVSDVARRWQISPTTVRWAARHGHLVAAKVGHAWLISARSAGQKYGPAVAR